MRRELVGNLVLGLVLTVLAAPALADDIVHPWWRDDARTTYERWEFGTNANPVPADEYIGEFSTPQAAIPIGDWRADKHGRQGVWKLSGEMLLEVENYPEPFEEKRVWIQVTWAGELPTVEAWGETDIQDSVLATLVSQTLLEDPWVHTTFEVVLTPNPTFETIFIHGGAYVDEVVIDTICIPEPVTLWLLALGGLAVIRRKRE